MSKYGGDKTTGDKTETTTRKLLNTAEGRADYLTAMYKDETKALKERTELQKKMKKAILEGKDDKAIKSIKRKNQSHTL